MAERLLTMGELLDVLRIDRSTFYRRVDGLKASGLQETRIGGKRLFRQSSVDKLIQKACEQERPIC